MAARLRIATSPPCGMATAARPTWCCVSDARPCKSVSGARSLCDDDDPQTVCYHAALIKTVSKVLQLAGRGRHRRARHANGNARCERQYKQKRDSRPRRTRMAADRLQSTVVGVSLQLYREASSRHRASVFSSLGVGINVPPTQKVLSAARALALRLLNAQVQDEQPLGRRFFVGVGRHGAVSRLAGDRSYNRSQKCRSPAPAGCARRPAPCPAHTDGCSALWALDVPLEGAQLSGSGLPTASFHSKHAYACTELGWPQPAGYMWFSAPAGLSAPASLSAPAGLSAPTGLRLAARRQ